MSALSLQYLLSWTEVYSGLTYGKNFPFSFLACPRIYAVPELVCAFSAFTSKFVLFKLLFLDAYQHKAPTLYLCTYYVFGIFFSAIILEMDFMSNVSCHTERE